MDYSAIVSGLSLGTLLASMGAVAVLMGGVYLARKGARILLSFIGR